MVSGDLRLKKGRHISRADLLLSFFNFHRILISVSLPLLIPASVLPDKPAVRCHAVREHDSLCSVGNRIKVIPLSEEMLKNDNGSLNDGYSHWIQTNEGWWFRYADGSYPKAAGAVNSGSGNSSAAQSYEWIQ